MALRRKLSSVPKKKKEPLSPERIVDAAVAMIDKDGLPAFSTRKLGESLGVEAECVVDMDGFNRCFEAGIRCHGPFLIEVMT